MSVLVKILTLYMVIRFILTCQYKRVKKVLIWEWRGIQ